MFATNDDLSEVFRTKVIEVPNAGLADATDLAMQVKPTH